MIHPADLTALWLTVKLALVSTVVLLLLGTPLGWWLATTRRRGRPVVDALDVDGPRGSPRGLDAQRVRAGAGGLEQPARVL